MSQAKGRAPRRKKDHLKKGNQLSLLSEKEGKRGGKLCRRGGVRPSSLGKGEGLPVLISKKGRGKSSKKEGERWWTSASLRKRERGGKSFSPCGEGGKPWGKGERKGLAISI